MDFIRWLIENPVAVSVFRDLSLIVVGLISLVFIIIRSLALRRSSFAAERQAETAELEQITDQYIKAVDQLSSDNLEIKLGGIYGLEKVANISDDFYPQIFEVLTAYVRTNAQDRKKYYKPEVDVQAVLDVIGRRRELFSAINMELNFSGSKLREYSFRGNFKNSNFDLCVIQDSNFIGFLNESNFSWVKCTDVSFREVSLAGVKFEECELTGTEFFRTDFSRSLLLSSDFSNSRFFSSNFTDCTFTTSRLSNTKSYNCDFNSSSFDFVQFNDAHINNCDFSSVEMKEVNLVDTKIANSKIDDIAFINTDINVAIIESEPSEE